MQTFTKTYKLFNQYLHDVCDPPARNAVSEYAKMKWGIDAKPNPNKYGVDLICYKKNQIVGYIEVEVRDWGCIYCPYDTIHIAERKNKLFENNLKTLMFVVTSDFANAYWTFSENIKTSPLKEIPNRAVAKNEWFYDVPITMWKLVDLTQKF